MAGDCTTYGARDGSAGGTFCSSRPRPEQVRGNGYGSAGDPKGRGPLPPRFEVIDGLLYRRKLERGFINYREVLDEERRHEAINAFHRRRDGTRHLSLEETYKAVAENYWWEGMYFHIRDQVLSCSECQKQRSRRSEGCSAEGRVSTTVDSHGRGVLSALNSQREAGLFCDITVRTEGRSYSAHRAVLAAVSEYFQEMFSEMDTGSQEDIDLTGFREESLVSLLDFSYSSTLCVRREDLHEVSAMARHLGMWPAVEACSTLLREQEQPSSRWPRREYPCRRFPWASADQELGHQKRKRTSSPDDLVDNGFSLTLDASDESVAGSPRRSCRGSPRSAPQSHDNGLPLSPTHRMKLLDFKSPSCKKSPASRSSVTPLQSRNGPSATPSPRRLLRSTPGAAQEVLKLLPRPESPRRNKRSYPVSRPPSTPRPRPSPARVPKIVKQERVEVVVDEEDDEEDYARAQEKYRLMNVLGLQRTILLPRPEDLIGWRQKKRLRKLKANNYSLTKRRKPRPQPPGLTFGDLPLTLPLCHPANTRLFSRFIKTEPPEEVRLKRVRQPCRVPPSDRSMRSKEGLSDLLQSPARPTYGGRELRQSVRGGDDSPIPVRRPPPPPRRGGQVPVRSMVRIKQQPTSCAISGPSHSHHGHSYTQIPKQPPPPPPPPRTVTRHGKAAVEAVRTLRYNSGRPVTKNKLRRPAATREPGVTQRKPREEERKARSSQGRRDEKELGNDGGLRIPKAVLPPSIYSHPLYQVIKEEPADPLPVTGASFPDPPSPDLGKRQSKPPIKLLDPGFLFSFCRPAGGPMGAVKREEESVDICLTRSVSQGERFGVKEPQTRVLRARGPAGFPLVKKEVVDRSQGRSHRPRTDSHHHHNNNTHYLARPAGSKVTRDMPKKRGKLIPLSSKKCVLLESIRRARLKQLRGPRSQAPKGSKSAHACLQCRTTYRDCDTLVMHRLRHVEGKTWPCPLCSKTFFRLRNVRNHIRTHDQKLYKCRSCISAAS